MVVRCERCHPPQRDGADVVSWRFPPPVSQQHPNGLERVFESDFLPFFVGAAVVRDRHLVHARAHACHLAGDLRLDAEVVRLQIETVCHIANEHLVTGLHVRQVQIGERVRQERQHPVADGVPEIQDAMAAWRAEKARSVHDVSFALEDGLQQQCVFARVVLEVGVLNDQNVSGRIAYSARDGRPFAHVLRLQQHAHAVLPVHRRENVSRAVGGPVVHDDELFVYRKVNSQNAGDDFADGGPLVEAGHHNRQLHGRNGSRLGPRARKSRPDAAGTCDAGPPGVTCAYATWEYVRTFGLKAAGAAGAALAADPDHLSSDLAATVHRGVNVGVDLPAHERLKKVVPRANALLRSKVAG